MQKKIVDGRKEKLSKDERHSFFSSMHHKMRSPCLGLLVIRVCIVLVVVYSLVKDRRDT